MIDGRLADVDPVVADLISREAARQREGLELIASENFVSPAVLECLGSVLTNKYADGVPGGRLYTGCGVVDELEALASDRAKALFGADHANVQPYSGTQANMAALAAVLEPGARILAMSPTSGGHRSHGADSSSTGKLYDASFYGLGEDERIDYDQVRDLASRLRPRLIIAGASLHTRTIDWAPFREAADACGALLLVDMAHIAGLVAAGLHPSPVPFADALTSTTHKTLRGPRGGLILCRQELSGRMDRAVFPCVQGGPLMHVIAGKAVCFAEASTEVFKDYQRAVVENAAALAGALQAGGLRLVAGGTDNHMVLVDVSPAGLTGKAAESALEPAGIMSNAVTTPSDTGDAVSGIRVGTSALTTRGMGVEEMKIVARLFLEVLSGRGNESARRRVREEVEDLCGRFPPYLDR